MTKMIKSVSELPETVSFSVSYDRRTDVLYISTLASGGSDARYDGRHGIIWRYDDAGNLVGATFTDFCDRWSGNKDDLTARISKRFHLPELQANKVVEHALTIGCAV
ncbi:DUF2283 domain-containing protein [Tianweitania sp. BSSL-BM11]|uniref:DUF2283 domain-containing protein n=1 Tax=Tianweitania aestuarii TaxID=2814886 RepID=A0ABS5RST5_9HYPH|nr:DUF2283 domain-containing protein [Tianweitania aestuarii]